MGQIHVFAEHLVSAPADVVYTCLADYRQHHPHILPDAFSDLKVEEGGVGAGTLISFTMTVGGRTRQGRMKVTEPQPGRVLQEADVNTSLVTTFTVTPEGKGCRVRIDTRWNGASGFGGFMERLFAPPTLRKLYADELNRLDAYAQKLAAK